MKYIVLAAITTVAVALSLVNWWLSSIAANNGVFVFNDMTALIGVNQVLAVVASSAAVWLWTVKQRSWSVVAVVVVLGCTVTDMHYTIKRVGSMSDTGVEDARGHNVLISRAYTRVEELKADVRAEAARGGCGKQCRIIKADLAQAQMTLASLGARRVEDSAAERVSAAFGGRFTPDQYRKALPVITAVALSLGCSLLFAMVTIMAMAGQVAAQRIIDVTPNPVIAELEQGATSNRELAKRLGWSEDKTSKQVKKLCASGMVKSEQRGRCKMISLA